MQDALVLIKQTPITSNQLLPIKILVNSSKTLRFKKDGLLLVAPSNRYPQKYNKKFLPLSAIVKVIGT